MYHPGASATDTDAVYATLLLGRTEMSFVWHGLTCPTELDRGFVDYGLAYWTDGSCLGLTRIHVSYWDFSHRH